MRQGVGRWSLPLSSGHGNHAREPMAWGIVTTLGIASRIRRAAGAQ